MWLLKEDQILSIIRWPIVEKVYRVTKITFCPPCLPEKLHLIEYFIDNQVLNKRKEFISGYRHHIKFLLESKIYLIII